MVEAPPNRLKELAEAKGVSRRELAAAIDVTEDRVRQLEKPETVIPSQHAPTLARLVGAEPAYLMGWDREPATAGEAA